MKFWTDIWHTLGRIIDLTGEVGTQKLGIQRNSRICEIVNGNEWSFRQCRDHNLRNLVTIIKVFPLAMTTEAEDVALWKWGEDDFKPCFKASQTWNLIRTHSEVQQWSKIVWFPQGIPRFSFITWLAVKDRLSTGSRMARWG